MNLPDPQAEQDFLLSQLDLCRPVRDEAERYALYEGTYQMYDSSLLSLRLYGAMGNVRSPIGLLDVDLLYYHPRHRRAWLLFMDVDRAESKCRGWMNGLTVFLRESELEVEIHPEITVVCKALYWRAFPHDAESEAKWGERLRETRERHGWPPEDGG